MDRNSAIGLTLIAGILVVYFMWFSPPTPQPKNRLLPLKLFSPKKENVIAQNPLWCKTTVRWLQHTAISQR